MPTNRPRSLHFGKRWWPFALCGVLLGATSVASAQQPLWCTGKVRDLWTNRDGNVYVVPSWRGDHIRICNVTTALEGVSPLTCTVWVSLLRNAVQRQANVTIHYSAATTTCAAMPTYSDAQVPYYVMLND